MCRFKGFHAVYKCELGAADHRYHSINSIAVVTLNKTETNTNNLRIRKRNLIGWKETVTKSQKQ